MTIITHELQCRATPETLWACLSDLTLVAQYNATVSTAKIHNGLASGVGAVRKCELKPKGAVVERVTLWEEFKALGLEIVESDWPITRMHWITKITPNGSGSTLSQRLEYDMKYGPLGALLNAIVMKRNVTGNVGKALEGLIRLAEQRDDK